MDILIGLQWGDEGKGKIIDLISRDYDIIARFNGGANAGHSIYHKGKRITLKLLPSGIFYPHIKNIIGTGVVIDPIALQAEVEQLQACLPDTGLLHRILVSAKAHLVLPTYKYWDIYFEESPEYRTIGTTKMVLHRPIPIKYFGKIYAWAIYFPKISKQRHSKSWLSSTVSYKL